MKAHAFMLPNGTSGLGDAPYSFLNEFLTGLDGGQAGVLAPAAEQQGQYQAGKMEDGLGRPRGGKRPLRKSVLEVEELQAELQRKHQEYQAAIAEQGRLRQRLKLLEVVLPVREQQLQMLGRQAAREQAMDGPAPQHVMCLLRPLPRITEVQSSDSSGCSPPLMGAPTQQEPHTLAPDGLIHAAGAQTSNSRAVGTGAGHAVAGPSHTAAGYSVDPPIFPPPDNRGSRGGSDHGRSVLRRFVSTWNTWLRDASLLLIAHDARPHDPGPSLKLARLRAQLMSSMQSLQQEHPDLLLDAVGVNLETGQREAPPPSDHWVAVVRGLSLSPEHTAACLEALGLFHERMGPTLSERQGLVLELTSAVQELQGQGQGGGAPGQGGGARGQALAARCSDPVLTVKEVTDKLHRNVVAEGQSLEILKDFLVNGVMSLEQGVRFCALSYPYFPDVLSIISTLAEVVAGQDPAVSESGTSQALAVAVKA